MAAAAQPPGQDAFHEWVSEHLRGRPFSTSLHDDNSMLDMIDYTMARRGYPTILRQLYLRRFYGGYLRMKAALISADEARANKPLDGVRRSACVAFHASLKPVERLGGGRDGDITSPWFLRVDHMDEDVQYLERLFAPLLASSLPADYTPHTAPLETSGIGASAAALATTSLATDIVTTLQRVNVTGSWVSARNVDMALSECSTRQQAIQMCISLMVCVLRNAPLNHTNSTVRQVGADLLAYNPTEEQHQLVNIYLCTWVSAARSLRWNSELHVRAQRESSVAVLKMLQSVWAEDDIYGPDSSNEEYWHTLCRNKLRDDSAKGISQLTQQAKPPTLRSVEEVEVPQTSLDTLPTSDEVVAFASKSVDMFLAEQWLHSGGRVELPARLTEDLVSATSGELRRALRL